MTRTDTFPALSGGATSSVAGTNNQGNPTDTLLKRATISLCEQSEPSRHQQAGGASVRYGPSHDVIDDILTAVTQQFRVPRRLIFERRRDREATTPRHVVFLLAYTMTNYSYPTLGRIFRRHHTTIISGIRSIKKRMAKAPMLERDVRILRERLSQKEPPDCYGLASVPGALNEVEVL